MYKPKLKKAKFKIKNFEFCKMELFCNIVLKDNVRMLAHQYIPYCKLN